MVEGSLAKQIKGMIPYPCCKKEKIMVFTGSSGRVSSKCPRCQKYAIFDYDRMTSEPGEVLRGASHELNR